MGHDPSATNEGGRRWWLSMQGKTEGPVSDAYVVAAVRTGVIPPDTQACPVGQNQWKAVSQWPELAGAEASLPPPPPPPPSSPLPPMPLPPVDSAALVTNPQLPAMANAICLYATVVSPVLWVVSNLSCCMTGVTFRDTSKLFGLEIGLTILDMFVSLAIVAVLVLGGLRLRSLRASGITWLKLGFLASLVWLGFSILLWIGVTLAADESDWAESTTAGDIVGFFLLCVGVLAILFEIIALVWLQLRGSGLPLRSS